MLAAAGESLAGRAAERRLGMVGETYRQGRAGALLRSARILTAAGGVGAALLGGRGRPAAVGAGLALLAGSACTRFGIFAEGIASAEDPVHTVGPQRGDAPHNVERKEPR
ncbi:hypothetical protein ACFVYE_33675 [Streptomyces sp. NPDC058239]|uniref:hypothetical protein n=1 Tax=Streptomyces sp. NPDC058239 TaxID=3346395 RepID=UPI0036E32B83